MKFIQIFGLIILGMIMIACSPTTLNVENKSGGPLTVTIERGTTSNKKISYKNFKIADGASKEVPLEVPVLNKTARVRVLYNGDYVSMDESMEVKVGESTPKSIVANAGIMEVTNNSKKDFKEIYVGVSKKLMTSNVKFAKPYGPLPKGKSLKITLPASDNYRIKLVKGLATSLGPYTIKVGEVKKTAIR